MDEFYRCFCGTVLDDQTSHLMSDEANCGRALLWDFLRRHWIAYDDHFQEFVRETDLPKRQPDEAGEGYAIWKEKDVS